MPEDFSFSLTWGSYGISSYDSVSGKLVKTSDATHPENYITELILTGEEFDSIFEIISALDVDSYPDIYNPNPDVMQEPSVTLVLTVTNNGETKTISAVDICDDAAHADAKGKKFINACREISQILTSSEEWQALPDYEFYYE